MKRVWCVLLLLGCVLRTALADPRVQVDQAASFEVLALQAAQDWSAAQARPVQTDVLGVWHAGAELPARYRLSSEVKEMSAHARQMRVRFIRDGAAGNEAAPEVRLRLRDMQQAWVLRAPLQAGQALGCEWLEQRLQVSEASGASRWSGPCTALMGHQARRPLGQGDTLMARDVRLPPAVSRLSTVVLKSVQGPIEIETSALALHDADVGQTVPVRPGGARHSVAALVVAPGTVTLK